jgi:gamma-glutamylcysteine synthetase
MPGGEKLTEFTKKILNLSSTGLRNRKIEFSGKNEETFLEPLRKILSQGDSPAEIWKNLYINQWSKDINMLYKNNYFKVTNDQT